MKVSDEPAFLDKEWETVSTSKAWSFSSDGSKSLYVKFADLNGLESSPYSVTFTIDTELPQVQNVEILNDWISTSSKEVYVDILSDDTGTGIQSVSFSTVSSEFSNGEVWVNYSASGRYNVNLGDGSGNKVLHVRVRDFAGRVSLSSSDSISVGSETLVKPGSYSQNIIFAEQPQVFTRLPLIRAAFTLGSRVAASSR